MSANSVAGLASPLLAALLLCLIGAVVSAFASSVAVLGSLIPLAVPFLQADTGVSADRLHRRHGRGLDHRRRQPVLDQRCSGPRQRAEGVDRDVFFRRLMTYGAIVTLVAPVVVWFLFVVL